MQAVVDNAKALKALGVTSRGVAASWQRRKSELPSGAGQRAWESFYGEKEQTK